MRYISSMILAVAVLLIASGVMADTFGTGGNQFTIDFVPISGATNPSSGYGIVDQTFRMGTYEITNDQWNKFKVSLSVTVTGNPSDAYDETFRDWGTGTTSVPTNEVSWYEAAQFVNWLNTSTNHQAAYKFTGTQGTGDYTLATWSPAEAAGGTNLYRNKDAFYFLPTEHEWVKAAYWNGTTLQTYATKAGESLTQGDGLSGTGWNYWDNGYATDPLGPWNVGSGSEELNGTYDMMGNVWEWMESPYTSGNYDAGSLRGFRGGYWDVYSYYLAASFRGVHYPASEGNGVGFRVASVPEPGSITLVLSGAMAALIWWRRRK
jgi:formylglycine-generating enzyme required for sulfatase activity